MLLLVSMLNLAINIKPVKANGTITIMADGSIDPETAPISTDDYVTYTFTGDINAGIIVGRDNIIIDGANHVLQGVSGTGIDVSRLEPDTSNVTIRNLEITSFEYGIDLSNADGNTIRGNNLTDGIVGVVIDSSNNNHVEGNRIFNYSSAGVYMLSASRNVVDRNAIVKSIVGIMGEYSSNNNVISENNITAPDITDFQHFDTWAGLTFNYASANNEIVGNIVNGSDTFDYGIAVDRECWNCSVSRNTIVNVDTDGATAILSRFNDLRIFENTIKNSFVGIAVDRNINASYINAVYHNNLVGNQYQAVVTPFYHFWPLDAGYPSGGNYWSDYNGIDVYSGLYQNETGADGIGDTPYNNNYALDRYPLMGPFGGMTNQGTDVAVFPSEKVGLIFPSVGTEGSVTVTESPAGPDPPSGFMISSGIYYDIKTTAEYSGTPLIRIIYDDSGMTPDVEGNLKLMQWDGASNSWQDITYRIDTENNLIYGIASHFSTFAVMTPTISWELVFQDLKRGTTLKISTDDKYFQFVALAKDFGVKQDLKMKVFNHVIIICYSDSQLLLVAAADSNIGFCSAVAWDKQTCKTYWLIKGRQTHTLTVCGKD
jgi:parallel beta-helix repeat protein